MPRFSFKELLLATTIFAVSLGFIAVGVRWAKTFEHLPDWARYGFKFALFGSGTALVVSTFAPPRRKWLSAGIGFVVGCAAVVVFMKG
jgi:hypothetical protein